MSDDDELWNDANAELYRQDFMGAKSELEGPSAPAKDGFKMCPPCSALWMRWLDYRLPPAPIRLDGTGIRTVSDIREYHERRYKQWRDEIRWQQAHIERLCREGNHYDPKTG